MKSETEIRSTGVSDEPIERQVAWFCLRARPKHEHIAARHLQQMTGVEVFLPRIRFRRKTRQGPAWVTEALFPNYLFARFDWAHSLRRVHHAPAVSGVIRFGDRWPTVPDSAIDELRALFGEHQIRVLSSEMNVGDNVEIVEGAFHGLRAVVTRITPGRERVKVLLDFLGRQTTVEVPAGSLIQEYNARKGLV
jgi:transcriptional antiterminator RfaH